MSRADDLFRAFNLIPTTALWRFELDGLVRTSDAAAAQVDAIFRHAWLAVCNDAMARRYGHERADAIVGARLTDLLPDIARNREYVHRFVTSGYQLANEESHEIGRHGEPKVFINNFVGVVEDGFLVSAWGTQVDVTAQREQELQLRQSDERLRLALGAAGMGTWRVDLRTGTNAHDESLNQIFGIAGAPTTGSVETQFLPLVHPDDRDRAKQAVERAVRDGTDYSEEMRIIRPDGAVRWIRGRGRVITDVDGSPCSSPVR